MNTLSASILSQTYNQLSAFASLENFWNLFDTAFGSKYNHKAAANLHSQWQLGDFSQLPEIEILNSSILGNANGAYASSTNKIYLSDTFLANATPAAISAVVLEEIGHFVDTFVNQSDSAGDEGAIFAELVQGNSLDANTLQALKAENDHATITVNGQVIQVEQQNFTGTDGNDDITGTSGDDVIQGLGGNDYLEGLGGNDSLYGGTGVNTLDGGDGNDTLVPGTTLTIGYGSFVEGGAGTDSLTVNFANADLSINNNSTGIFGRYSGDRLLGISNVEILNITGGSGDDVLQGFAGNDTLNGGQGNDSLDGGTGVNTLNGGDGNDTLIPATGASIDDGSVVDGGAGTDTLTVNFTNANSQNLGVNGLGIYNNSAGFNSRYLDSRLLTISNLEILNITGTPYADSIQGFAGNDTITGGANDILDGGAGYDTLNLNLASATTSVNFNLTQVSNQITYSNTQVKNFETVGTLTTGSGSDAINLGNNAGVDDGGTVDTGTGTDTLIVDFTNANYEYLGLPFYDDFGNEISVGISNNSTGFNLRYYDDRLLTINNVEILNITGTPYDDQLNVEEGDSFDGGAGYDTLNVNLASTTTSVNLDISQISNQLTYSNTQVKNFETVGILTTGSGNDAINLGNNGGVDDGGTVNTGTGTDTLIVDFTNANYEYLGLPFYDDFGNEISVGISNNSTGFNLRYYDDRLLTINNVEILNITGTPYDDQLNVEEGDSFDGGAGYDTLNVNLASTTTSVNLDISQISNQLTYGNTQVKNFETVGTLTTGSGNDAINLGNNAGVDDGGTVNTGTGTDTLIVDFTNANYEYLGLPFYDDFGNEISVGISNNSTGFNLRYYDDRLLTISNVEILNITGTPYDDVLQGFAGNDTLIGGAGNDSITGGAGNDILIGGASNDSITGGAGNDILIGVNTSSTPGRGEIDYLAGGIGADSFVLGDSTWIGYDNGNTTNNGNADYAEIAGFNSSEGDVIQLQGTSSNYLLAISGANTQILIDKPGTEPDELIGIVKNQTSLNLSGSYFNYVSTTTLPNITFALSPTSVTEDGATNLVYTFTRTGSTTSALTVNYGVSGTATFNTDYTQTGAASFTDTAGSITFAAGASTKTLTIDPTADTTIESNETLALTLATGTGYTIGTTTAVTGTINNDDFPSITLAISPSSVTEDGTTNLVYTFTRTGSTTNALTVNYGVAGTATFNTDYTQTGAASFTATTGTISFAAGSTTTTLTLDPTADTTIENDETVGLTLTAGTDYTIGTTTAVTGTITNDDFPIITIAATDATAAETATGITPNPGIFTFTRTGSTTNTLSVNYTLTGTATNGTDYTTLPTNVTFAAGSSTATVTVNPTDDSIYEDTETAILNLATGTGYTIGTTATATVNLADNDPQFTINLSPDQTIIEGNTSPQNATYTVSLSNPSTQTITVNYATANGTALTGSDYTSTTGTLTFNPGVTSQAINIPILNNSVNEANETFTLKLTNPTNANLGTTNIVTTTITDTLTASVTTTLPTNVENLTLIGTDAIDGTGNVGNNILQGNSANNTLAGANGNDTYSFVATTALGTDTITETTGTDTINFSGTTVATNVNLGVTTSQTVNSNLKLILSANNVIENATGGTGNDRITGNALNNTLNGSSGNDQLQGLAGNDTLLGGAGIDTLTGGSGNDLLWGELNDDILTGGLGSDKYQFKGTGAFSTTLGVDYISEFEVGQDQIVLSKTTFKTVINTVGQALTDFAVVSDDDFVDANSARIVYSQSTGSLFYNQNGNVLGATSVFEFARLGNPDVILAGSDFSLVS